MMKNIRNRNWIATGIAAASLTAVVAGVAVANPGPSTDTASTVTDDDQDAGEQDPDLNGSIPVPEGLDEGPDEATALESLATISKDAAITAAGGDAGAAAELGNENGSLVWEVDVTNDDGTVDEVKVDAGNGKVLDREAEDDDEADDDDVENENEHDDVDGEDPEEDAEDA